ncbi:MAG: polysaccharide lyase family protein [Planctomycetota bacterium]
MKTSDSRFAACLTAVLLFLPAATDAGAAAPQQLLWEIGAKDGDNRELALAPDRYAQFRDDAFFVVGWSDPKADWPYVHPGPNDGWAGSRSHTFTILFGLRNRPEEGECRLTLDLLDTHSQAPPTLRITVNGHAFDEMPVPRGAGDASVFGDPRQGRRHTLEISFPADVLREGENEVAITSLQGSWVLYDRVALEGPPGLAGAPLPSRTSIASIEATPLLTETKGSLHQIVRVAVRHVAAEVDARVQGASAEPIPIRLRPGSQILEVPLAAVAEPTTTNVTIAVAGKVLATRGVELKPVRHWVVYLLPHSHVDIGYTHVQTDVERAQWSYLEMAIDTARRTADYPPGARFKWNVEVLWAVDSYLQRATPEKREAFYEAVRKGQVGLDALYGNMLTGLCRPEELLRLLRLAPELAQRTGVKIESAMITDVPGYTWGIVPAFAQTGIKYFSIGPNGGDRIGHTSAAWGDKPFWWIGPNGTDRVLAWMTGTGYWQVFRSSEQLLDYLGRLEESGYPYDMVQVRHCLGDNGAPDVDFADRVRAWNESHAYPKLVIATTAEMFHDFEQRYGSRIPTAKGDFTPYWEDGAASSALETQLNRTAAERLVQAETLYAMLDRAAYPVHDFYKAWRNVILYDEHTWGAYNSVSEPDHPFVKAQWEIKRAFAVDADRQSQDLLAAAVKNRGPEVAGAFDVFNTTCFERDGERVEVPNELAASGDIVVAADGEVMPTQRFTTGELVFLAQRQPGFSQKRYFVKKGTAGTTGMPATATVSAEEGTLANFALSLKVDKQTGAITSLRTKDSQGREIELVDPWTSTGLNDYFYLPGSDLNKLKRNGPVEISVGQQGPVSTSLFVKAKAPGCRELRRTISLIGNLPRVFMVDGIDKRPVREKEGVHLGFAFNVPDGVMRMDVPWAVVRPETDQIPGACKNWFTVQRWVDISNESYGVTWATLDAPLVEVGGITANLIGSLNDPRHWLDRLEPSQTLYSWAMNNHWHTNYCAEQKDWKTFRYWILVHQGPYSPIAAARFGTTVSQPLIAVPARGEPLPEPRLHLSDSSVQVTAFKPSDDGKAWIVRLFGASGESRRTELQWSEPKPRSLSLSDNSERPLKALAGPVEVPAWSIVTMRAERPE